jgi:hypothetical protein
MFVILLRSAISQQFSLRKMMAVQARLQWACTATHCEFYVPIRRKIRNGFQNKN